MRPKLEHKVVGYLIFFDETGSEEGTQDIDWEDGTCKDLVKYSMHKASTGDWLRFNEGIQQDEGE